MPSALIIQLNTQSFTSSLGNIEDLAFQPPVPTGLQAWFNIGLDADRSRHNWAEGKADATIVGAPDFADGYAVLTGNANYIETDVSETADFTMMVAVRLPAVAATSAAAFMIAGNYTSPSVSEPSVTSSGLSLWQLANVNQIRGQIDRRSAGVSTIQFVAAAAETVNEWQIIILRGDGLDLKYRNATTGLEQSNTATNPRFLGSRKLSIGDASSSFAGSGHVATFAYWNRALTDAECDTAYAKAKSYLAGRFGISI